MASKLVIKSRQKFLSDYLMAHPGEDVTLAQLSERMYQEPGLAEPPVSLSHLKRFLQRRVASLLPGVLTLRGKNVRLDVPVDYVLRQRQQIRPRTKRRLGQALWHLLLQAPLPPDLHVAPSAPEEYRRHGWSEPFLKTLQSLRNGPVLSLYADAGSTTLETFKCLEDYARLAFPVRGKRMVHPRLQVVTSSLSVASAVCQSRHRHDIQTVVVGGQVNPEYESISGILTQKLMPHYEMANSVALLGATGFRSCERRGGPSLLCNSTEESFAKSSFISMADTAAVVLMDSTKLKNHSPNRVFASLESIDLVVIDGGTDDTTDADLPRDVEAFRREAVDVGVAVAVVNPATGQAADKASSEE